MKNKIILFVLSLVLSLGCKNENERLKEKLLPIIKSSAISDGLVYKVDSLIIYKIDTLTTLKDSLNKIDYLTKVSELELLQTKSSSELASIETQSGELSFNQYRLYKEMFGSGAITDSELNKAKEHLKKSKELLVESKIHSNNASKIENRIQNILNLSKNQKLDSITFKGYIVYYRLKGSNKNNIAVKLDSLYNFINPDLRIIRVGDYNRN